MTPEPLLVVAGEASGDQRAARLIASLLELRPQVAAFGMGGDSLRAAGMVTLHDSSEIAVVGIAEALRVLPQARRIFRRLLAETSARRCRSALLVDSPDFNLRLARALHRRGVRVLYYVSPQVWAWRRGRVRLIRRVVDRMLVLFPFEVDFYSRHGVDAVCVGHPLVDEVPALATVWDREPRRDFAAETNEPERPRRPQPEVYRIALLPGSRNSELDALLPVLLGAVDRLASRLPISVRLIVAPSTDRTELARRVEAAGATVDLVVEDRYEAIADSHLAICASGTATLEVGLLTTPLLIVYRMRPWTYRLAKWLVRLPHIGMVNLVLGAPVAPELVQADASPERIAAEAVSLLRSPERIAAMRESLAGLRQRLGEARASERAAREVAGWLEER